ncbi:leucine-rich repeat protein [Fusibacter sp. 3D3]|uniref:leucine-rich repeat protein n=1 Tax=Fusibacter sp. 3D3 TaxID=1048380 RepID=UPI0008537A9B|nr:leucine-rich repeat protein [Fusibacter sp. 3D3]GAU77637.1 predicted glycoside hydrolase [Fusibacter sp. 3D3]
MNKATMKKFISMGLVLTLLIGLTSGGQMVWADSAESDFTFDSGTGTITGYTGAGGNVVIPSTIGGVAVVAIGEDVFNSNIGIVNVIISEGVETIGPRAFTNCYALKSVSLPESATRIGYNAFYSCFALSDINIPNSITEIPIAAFGYCTLLERITLPDNLESIEASAFIGCDNLKSIIFPSNLTSVGNYAFKDCTYLRQAVFTGNEPITFGTNVFSNTNDTFEILYESTGSGFTTPTWKGYSSSAYDSTTTYSLNYDANGGTGSMPGVNGLHTGDLVTVGINNNLIVKADWQFVNWNTKADGTGVAYYGDQIVPVGNKEITLYAKWERLHSINTDTVLHGSITVDKSRAISKDEVTITVTPDEGWSLKGINFKNPLTGDLLDIRLIITENSGAIKFFDMIDEDILVTAEFMQGEFTYETTSDSAIAIKHYQGIKSDVVIPREIDGKPVTKISTLTFGMMMYVNSIRIPNSVNEIEEAAAYDCGNLKSVFFEGNAPEMFKTDSFFYSDPAFEIYYVAGSTGFTTPNWNGYSTVAILPSDIIAADKASITVGYTAGDSATAVTQNLRLSSIGATYGSDITWCSSDTSVISNDGIVTRPAYLSGDANITLTATVNKNSTMDTQTFNLVVLKLPFEASTITFDKNGGDTEVSPITVVTTSGSSVTVLPTAPTRLGYTFNGWNTAADGTGMAFTASTVVDSDITVYAQWVQNSDSSSGNNSGGSSESGSSGGGTPTTGTSTLATGNATTDKTETVGNITKATTVVKAVERNGKSIASPTSAQISDAVNKAKEIANTKGSGTKAVVEIEIESAASTTSVSAILPKTTMSMLLKGSIDALSIKNSVASITFDQAAIKTLSSGVTEDIAVNISKVDNVALSEASQKRVGDRPVYNFSVTSGNQTISQFGGDVTVSVPYALGTGEDANAVVIYYINALGHPELMSDCIYDVKTGMITFKTNHFSSYAVGYNKVNFNDVAETAWYADAVTFISTRDIANGTGDGNFSPNAKLTRGQFLVMMMKAYGISADENSKENFSDAGSTYYTGYLAAAKKQGIAAGIGNNMFAPEKNVTRQEMLTLLYNALKQIEALPAVGTAGADSTRYTDDEIVSWAKVPVTLLVGSGAIDGIEGRVGLTEPTTRAEMAQVLYNLLTRN